MADELGVDESGRWNVRQWAREHERLDETRFNAVQTSLQTIGRILLGAGGALIVTLLGVLGWSLTQQYDAQQRLNATIERTSELSADKAAKKAVAAQYQNP